MNVLNITQFYLKLIKKLKQDNVNVKHHLLNQNARTHQFHLYCIK